MPLSMTAHLENLGPLAGSAPYRRTSRGLVQPDGSAIHRSARRERARLRQYFDALPTAHRDRVRALADALPAIDPRCRISVQVPARFEAGYLRQFLDVYANQRALDRTPLPPRFFDVLVVNNRLAGERPDDSAAVFAEFRAAAGERADDFHFVDVELDVDEPYPLTLVRRLGADITIARLLARENYPEPVYFALEDADTVWLDPRQLAIQVAVLDARPELDGVRGQQDRCPWVMCENDLLVALRRSWNFTEAYLARESLRPHRNPRYDFTWNRVVTSGWNSAVSAEAFAVMGGYTPDRRLGEDVDIGERLSCVRGGWRGDEFVPEVGTIGPLRTRAEGSPRRWLLRVAADVDPYNRKNGYENFFSRTVTDQIRSPDYSGLLAAAWFSARLSPANAHLFEDALSRDFEFTLKVRGNRTDAEDQWRWVCHALGLHPADWRITGDRVRLLSLDRLAEALNGFRARNRGRPAEIGKPARPVGRVPAPRPRPEAQSEEESDHANACC
ncbi:hypothetical protein [Streptoalloteichus hindustanus]|nr:hypothetical protein [Streptoalloteichus hindustanus]